MKLQVLVAAMNQTDHSLLDKLNIQSDVIVGNQTDHDSIEHFNYKKYKATYLNFNERGVGLNRNNALMRADADICLIADDDMVYVDHYPEIVINAFQNLPHADIIIFNLAEKESTRYVIKKIAKVGYLNYLRYGTARIAFKLSSIRKNGIFFNQCFGGGTEHSHGEDNLFLNNCLKAGLKIYAYPAYIAKLTEERESTWNKGYSDKYFRDQGKLYYQISKRWWKILCLQDAVRHKKLYNKSVAEIYKKMTV
jgi:hypothetical protein